MYSFPNFKPVHYSTSGSIASWPAYRFLRRQVKWPVIPISFVHSLLIHTVKGFSIVIEADVFLEFSCFFYDAMDVGNLVSGSSVTFRHDKIFQPPFCHLTSLHEKPSSQNCCWDQSIQSLHKTKIHFMNVTKAFLSDYSTEEILIAHYLSKNKYRLILSYTKYFYFGPSILMCP